MHTGYHQSRELSRVRREGHVGPITPRYLVTSFVDPPSRLVVSVDLLSDFGGLVGDRGGRFPQVDTWRDRRQGEVFTHRTQTVSGVANARDGRDE